MSKHQIKGILISLGFIFAVGFLNWNLGGVFSIILVLLCLLAVTYYIASRSIRTIPQEESKEDRKENP